ncbi:MAG: hypothetical protein EBY20_09880 [Alphaproteobacteria bacterium]|nr:hypothetical protein [Alphaproteobacteria bacterium]
MKLSLGRPVRSRNPLVQVVPYEGRRQTQLAPQDPRRFREQVFPRGQALRRPLGEAVEAQMVQEGHCRLVRQAAVLRGQIKVDDRVALALVGQRDVGQRAVAELRPLQDLQHSVRVLPELAACVLSEGHDRAQVAVALVHVQRGAALVDHDAREDELREPRPDVVAEHLGQLRVLERGGAADPAQGVRDHVAQHEAALVVLDGGADAAPPLPRQLDGPEIPQNLGRRHLSPLQKPFSTKSWRQGPSSAPSRSIFFSLSRCRAPSRLAPPPTSPAARLRPSDDRIFFGTTRRQKKFFGAMRRKKIKLGPIIFFFR